MAAEGKNLQVYGTSSAKTEPANIFGYVIYWLQNIKPPVLNFLAMSSIDHRV